MQMKRTVWTAVTALGTAATLALTAGPAGAAPTPGAGLDAAKKVLTARIDGRLETLRALNVAIGGATHLSSAHKSSLQGIVDNDQSGLGALKTKVAGETTTTALKADATSMVDDYRIYVLATPQVHLVIAADLETTAGTELSQAADKLATAIDTAKKAGKDTIKAEADLADMRAQISASGTALSGKADAILAVKPGPDANAIHASVTPVRNAVHSSRGDLKKATQDAKAVKTDLGLS
jgi:hypothetical protein